MTDALWNGARAAVVLAGAVGLSACSGGLGAVGNMFGANPAEGVEPALERPAPDSRGVITYANYQVIEARAGDTIPAMAARVGLSPEELASHNGLPVSYTPRAGEILALPRMVGPGTGGEWSPERAESALAAAGPTATDLPPAGADRPFSNGQAEPVIDPVRHRVKPGETAFSIARLYGVSVTALASWNGLDSDFSLRTDQELLIPVTADRRTQSAARPESGEDAAVAQPGTRSTLPPPPSAARPLPENQDVASVEVPDVDISDDLTPPGASRKLLRPVEGGSVLRGYEPSGPDKNEGIDYAVPAGTPVRAAEDGEVALISRSLGGLGTIVLIRHPDDLLTVYGRIDQVRLEKGDSVRRGQQIGVVADGETPNLHFEIRRGTESVDPAPYL